MPTMLNKHLIAMACMSSVTLMKHCARISMRYFWAYSDMAVNTTIIFIIMSACVIIVNLMRLQQLIQRGFIKGIGEALLDDV